MQYPLKFNAALHIWNRSLLSRVLEHFKNIKTCLREQPYNNIIMLANIIWTGNDTILSSETRSIISFKIFW